MLEKLDEINWKNVKHAYGPAADVPADIRNLASADQKVREKALYHLYGNIFHQGTRYEATPYAIPFLYELIQAEAVEDKHEIILLLVHLALGYADEYLPDGMDVKKYRKELAESEANMTAEERADCKKYGYSPRALLDCYELVKAGLPVLLNCLKSSDKDIRKAATYAVSWFPELAETSVPEIIKQLENPEEDTETGNALLAIGLLARQAETAVGLSKIRIYLNADSQLVRLCAAIALARHPVEEAALETLIEGIKWGKSLNYVKGMLFKDGQISGYAGITLSGYGRSEKEKIIPALCQVLETVNAYQALDITHAMLSIINEGRTILIKDEKPENLTSLETQALNAIYEHGGWQSGTGGFVNYFDLLRSAGVPDSKEALGRYLNKR